jgi:type IV pilus assembly protein PilY1
MRRTQILTACWLLCSVLGLAALPAAASAQDDLRGIVPFIMLVVDTSTSMERQATCNCVTSSCSECLPRCNLSNDVNGLPPPEKKNRWALTLEALTGTFNNFECDPIERSVENGMTYDAAERLPYHQPWTCTGPSGTPCAFDATTGNTPIISQNNNGILDLNVSGIRFGLMTFDGIASYGRDEQRGMLEFDDARSEGIDGLWSYGGKKTYRYPGCPHEYVMDTGARSSLATEGALISLESCSGPGPRGTPGCEAWCTACPATQDTVNRDIQRSLLAARPFGSTPIAAALDDLYFHFKDDLSDAFQSCRDRFAILITDGAPDPDYRFNNCDCNEPDSGKNSCAGLLSPTEDPQDMHCPYPKPEQVALDLVEGRGTDGPMLERLYVLGLAVGDNAVTRAKIEVMADNGCTEVDEECEIGETGSPAIFADNLDSLRAAVQVIVDDNNHTVSRTTPVFVASGNPDEPQYQFSSALKLPTQADQPWHGVLERRRFVCGAGGVAGGDFVDLTSEDRFHDTLNSNTSRRLLTAYPSSLGADREGVLVKESTSCGTSGCPMRELSSISATELQVVLQTSSPLETQGVIDWMYARSTTPRDDAALGAIYHSTPAISGAPLYDTADPAFNNFRRIPEIANRPQVLFVGTTDGVLHAFSTGDYNNSIPRANWRDLRAGEELWGFVPAMLLNDLRTNLTSQQFLMDGAPVIRTVNIDRSLGAGVDGYRTILTMGMREGGNAYIALDITDPFNPQFLWQVSSPAIGKTYGQPGLVQARFRRTTAAPVTEGAIAILPGGVGQRATGGIACDGGSTQSLRSPVGSPYVTKVPQPSGNPDNATHRFDVKCWSEVGRSLTFLDASDGFLLKQIWLDNPGAALSTSNQPFFPSPLVSAPQAFPDDVASVATRAFITDADGVIWRIELGSPDVLPNQPQSGWTARPFHDIFWDKNFAEGELTYEAPLLSIDSSGLPIVIVGTGDTANFTKPTVENRIVSLTEIPVQTTPGYPSGYAASMNWELRVKPGTTSTEFTDGTTATVDGLAPSELVTGSMGLFEGQLFAGTFIAVANTDNVCDNGRGRLFALDYIQPDFRNDSNALGGTTVRTFGPMRINASDPTDTNSIVNILRTDEAGDNVKISGISLVQVPSCVELSSAFTDSWGNHVTAPTESRPPDVRMMAHADDDNNDPSDTVDQRNNSEISTVNVQLKAPDMLTRILSWAAIVD